MKDVLKTLRFVQGAVAKKDLVPALTHFHIENGRIQGYNGRIALSAPIELNVEANPKAAPLVRAISRCEETVQLGLTKTNRLSIKSGKFRSYIDCTDDVSAHVEPEGKFVDIDGELFIEALKKLEPLVGQDAARPWSNGILFRGQSAYATNNVILAEYWLGSPFPVEVNVPHLAIKEILRLKEPPERFQMADSSLTVHYSDGRWLRCTLIANPWPDIAPVFNVDYSAVQPIPESFFTGLDTLKDFTDKYNRIVFEPGRMRTHSIDYEEGAAFECDYIQNRSTFTLPMLQKLSGLADKLDLTAYPNPSPWMGENIRGVIIGLHWLEGEE
ncbi:MAG: putative beta sliding clamp [Prokaryotic dsDNA virus sp.]|nr:MAG: putative beta sliding clamp [Prokaryotic dsDNA virus sp.]|tara:strand:+ start:30698 stop:31681 length:984 start_codon:yes stop_codon:yes gene_type:complete